MLFFSPLTLMVTFHICNATPRCHGACSTGRGVCLHPVGCMRRWPRKGYSVSSRRKSGPKVL